MSGDISLFELVNRSIGTPEPGSVDFGALHTLLHAMLEHLHIQDVSAVWRDTAEGRGSGESSLNPCRSVEDRLRDTERQLAALERLPSGSELLAGSGSVSEVWQLLQIRSRVEGSEDGVTKCVDLIQDLLAEIKELKESRDSLKKEVENLQNQFSQINVDQLMDKVTGVEQCIHHVEDLKSATQELKEKVTLYPEPEELTQCVTWEVMQAALVSERQKTVKELKDSIIGSGPLSTPLNVGSALTRRDSSACGLPGSAESPGSTYPVLGSSQIPASQEGLQDTVSEEVLPLLSRVSSGAQHYPETVEALRNVGRLQEKHESLEARVEFLEGDKADHAQLQQLREQLSDMEKKEMSEDIQEQLKSLKEAVMADRDKVTEMESLIVGSASVSGSSQIHEQSVESEANSQGTDSSWAPQQQIQELQIAYIRIVMQKLYEEVTQLKQDVAAVNLEQKRITDKPMLDQSEEIPSPAPDVPGGGQGDVSDQEGQTRRASVSDSVDLSRKVSQLFQYYETLNSMISGFMNQQSSGGMMQGSDDISTGQQQQSLTSELVSDVQETILCLKSECEQLHITTNHLKEDHSQKQSHIDYLYKAMEELDKKKADREVVEMKIDIKADKQALETKVSCTQFDSKTEHLNAMLQELLSKVTCQEQDWNKFIEKISSEMESKLDRMELEPLKQQLEDLWRSIRKQLQAQPASEYDEAAGFRKQLVERFNCISCDRPIDMMTPGGQLMTVPTAPGFPSHKSTRPYTVYELEQVRQHSKRNIAQRQQTPSEKHSRTDREQNRFDSSQTYRQDLREIIQKDTITGLPPISIQQHRTRLSLPQHERIPETANSGYVDMSRSCGGSHTLTYANRRYSHLQHITQLLQTEEEEDLAMLSPGMRIHTEVDIVGVDGHIYKGRVNARAGKTLESRLPTISSKEGSCKSRDRGSRCQTQKSSGAEPGRKSPLSAQSAKTQGSCLASSSSVKDRPEISMDCLSQPVVPQSSADPDSELLQTREFLRDFSQSKNTPVTPL